MAESDVEGAPQCALDQLGLLRDGSLAELPRLANLIPHEPTGEQGVRLPLVAPGDPPLPRWLPCGAMAVGGRRGLPHSWGHPRGNTPPSVNGPRCGGAGRLLAWRAAPDSVGWGAGAVCCTVGADEDGSRSQGGQAARDPANRSPKPRQAARAPSSPCVRRMPARSMARSGRSMQGCRYPLCVRRRARMPSRH